MINRLLIAIPFSLAILLVSTLHNTPIVFAAEVGTIKELPSADKEGGMPLMNAFAARKTEREFSRKPISDQILSNLLWAVWGINREDGRRTVPTPLNRQSAVVFVALEDGLWEYDAQHHALVLHSPIDLRAKAGGAPIELIFAAPENISDGIVVGAMVQSAALYCASEGLANVPRTSKAKAFNSELILPNDYKVMVTHGIGYR